MMFKIGTPSGGGRAAVRVKTSAVARAAIRAAALAVLLSAAAALFCGCASHISTEGPSETETEVSLIRVGFSQLGAESDWREANTASMEETFCAENGFELLMENGQQQQTNQITSIRRFIQQGVDYIVLAPVTEQGWDTVLQEAREAGIPVIIADRMVDTADEDLYLCRVGSDFELEGRKASEWLYQFTLAEGIEPGDIHIADIQGTIGASAQIGRTKGLEEAAQAHGWDLLAEVTGDFTQNRGYEAMKGLLEAYPELNVVYCENDNSALGAIEAIGEAGRSAGSRIAEGDILVISFDGVNAQAMEYALEDRITCIAQCNPEQGPLIRDIIEQVEAGGTPDKISYVDEGLYSAYAAIRSVDIDGSTYPVTLLSEEVLAQKEYWQET